MPRTIHRLSVQRVFCVATMLVAAAWSFAACGGVFPSSREDDSPSYSNQPTTPTESSSSDTTTTRFVDNGDWTIYDWQTKLTWEKDHYEVALTWQDAMEHCSDLSFADRNDWRAPVIEESKTILTSENNVGGEFPLHGCHWDVDTFWGWCDCFWTSSDAGNNSAWMICFDEGIVAHGRMTSHTHVRCVRP